MLCLKKTECIKKKIQTDMTFHDIYSSGGLWDKK